MRRAIKLNAPRHFEPNFGELTEVKIELMIAHWKALSVCYPTQVEFFNLELIFASKTSISKTTFCWCKRWQKGDFHGVFGPLGYPKLDEISRPFLSMNKFS